MRLQIYIPGKTPEDLALREALKDLPGQELKDLLVLGWAAKNSTTKPEIQESTGDSGDHGEVSTTKSGEENEGPNFCSTNLAATQEFSTTNLDTPLAEPFSEEVAVPAVATDEAGAPSLDQDEAVWRDFVSSIEPPATPIYQEVELPDLAKMQANTDAARAEREEVKKMLDEQRQNQGPDPLDEAKKNLKKAQEVWGTKRNGDSSTTQ